MNLSPHFTIEEFTSSGTAKRIGSPNQPNEIELGNLKQVARRMEAVRFLLNDAPIKVTSAFRDERTNKAVGGVANSDHRLGWAVDFHATKYGTPFDICNRLVAANRAGVLQFDQLIHEHTWVHISFNPRMRNQLLTLKKGGGGYLSGIVK